MIPLGKWVARSPRIWRIFWDSKGNNGQAVSDTEGLIIYQNDRGREYFRAMDNVAASPKGVPATVESSSEYNVKLRCTGDSHFYEPEEESKPFIEFLQSWRGKWMWEDLRLDKDPSWIVECLRKKTLTCVTDGSYMKDKAANICSAGWVMACKQTKRHISSSLVGYHTRNRRIVTEENA